RGPAGGRARVAPVPGGRSGRGANPPGDALAVDANQSAASLVAAAATHRMHVYARRVEWLA
ncbi:heme biosynthesis protein HemY, partial [Burkholderia pseudomallei]